MPENRKLKAFPLLAPHAGIIIKKLFQEVEFPKTAPRRPKEHEGFIMDIMGNLMDPIAVITQ